MKKRKIWILVLCMAVVVVSLILVQMYWIKNSLEVNHRQFNIQVRKALAGTIHDLNEQLAAGMLMNAYPSQQQEDSVSGMNFDISVRTDSNWLKTRIVRQGTTRFSIPEKNASGNFSFYSESYSITRRTPQGIDEIIPKGNGDAAKSIQQRRAALDKMMQKMMMNPLKLINLLDKNELDKTILENLKENGIEIGYEFAVTNHLDKVSISSENFNPSDENEMYRMDLNAEDLFELPVYLWLYFPGERKYLLKSVGFVTSVSILLSIIIIVLFGVTLFIIYRQKRLSEIKSDFINNMTHELKTPISTISLASQMLDDPSIPVEAKNIGRITGIIKDECKKLGNQVEKVLHIAVFEKGKIKLKMKTVNILEILQSLVSSFDIQISNRNGEIHLKADARNHNIKADPVHISNVFSNILDNALKYTQRTPIIEISTKQTEWCLNVHIKDNGMGISKNNLNRIFDQFYRIPTGNVHNVKGFGLGLSYAKHIVDEHKGKIDVKSEQGKGTEFIISLPYDQKQNTGNGNYNDEILPENK